MEERRWWRRISLHQLNVVLYLALVGIVLACGPQLGWAVGALPVYLGGNIPSPVERSLYLAAAELPPDEARPLLERSLAIDPNTEAVHILARKLVEAGEPEQARSRYERYLEIDPFVREAYLELASLLEGQGKTAEATRVLERGVAQFRANVERFQPREDPSVEERYNAKARRIYAEYGESVRVLEAALERLR